MKITFGGINNNLKKTIKSQAKVFLPKKINKKNVILKINAFINRNENCIKKNDEIAKLRSTNCIFVLLFCKRWCNEHEILKPKNKN